MALAGLLSAVFGVLLEPMEADLGWTRAQLSTGPMFASVMGLFLAAPAGYLVDRWGSRLTGVFVVAASFLAIIGMSQVDRHLWHWWTAWSIFGIAGAFSSTVWMSPVSKLFRKARGMAIAVTISGASISATVGPPIAEFFLQAYGWRTAFIAMALIWCGLSLPLVLAFVPGRRKAERKSGKEQAPEGTGMATMAETGGLAPREGFRSRSFYLIFFASLLSGLAALSLLLNLVPILTFTGIARTDAVIIAGMMGVASLGGRLVAGWLMDNFDIRRLAIVGAVLSAVFPLALAVAPGIFWVASAATMFHGMVGGLRFSAIVYLTTAYLGARSFGLFYGAITTGSLVASGLGPLLANYAYDQTQSYLPAIWAAVPGFLISGLLFLALGPAPDFSHPSRGR